ncbi:hypothetical protein Y032_0357g3396 [Ancylostoma ceylanicum]|uniref:SCP domain-containing protein n=1 Tax=Ancylostoma ceylanicum TaxID=53326 RepID=A0A016RWB7_9BILA|nr:hypothetical protein Y032_0357g3396 [Ancylostoma ceylanicum]
MAAIIRTLFWAVFVLPWVSNVFSSRVPKCSESKRKMLSYDVRKLIYEEISKRVPKRPKYSCYLEEDAALLIYDPDSIRPDIGQGEKELSYKGRWRSSFIEDVVKRWTLTLKEMRRLQKIGCFYKAPKRRRGTAELACIFRLRVLQVGK